MECFSLQQIAINWLRLPEKRYKENDTSASDFDATFHFLWVFFLIFLEVLSINGIKKSNSNDVS